MERPDHHMFKRQAGSPVITAVLLAFGIAMLMLLVLVERQQWHPVRPAAANAAASQSASAESLKDAVRG